MIIESQSEKCLPGYNCVSLEKKIYISHEEQGIVSNQVLIIIREQCARVVHQQWVDSAHLIYTALSFNKCRIDSRAIPINHSSAGKKTEAGMKRGEL